MVSQGWRITSTWIGVVVALFAAPAVVVLVRNAYGSAKPVRITESPVGVTLDHPTQAFLRSVLPTGLTPALFFGSKNTDRTRLGRGGSAAQTGPL